MTFQMIVTSIVVAIAVAGVVAAAWRRERYASSLSASMSAAQAWREERDAELARRQRLEAELAKAQDEIRVLKDRVGELERHPDLRALQHLIELNEERAASRTDKVLAALELIATALTDTHTATEEAPQ